MNNAIKGSGNRFLTAIVVGFLSLSLFSANAQYKNGEAEIITPIRKIADQKMQSNAISFSPKFASSFLVKDTINSPTKVSFVINKENLVALRPSVIYKMALPAVAIAAMCSKPNPLRQTTVSSASAFLISSDGICVTNYHVLYAFANTQSFDGKGVFLLRLIDGNIYEVKSVLAVSASDDIILLQLDTKGAKVPFLQLSSEDAHIGDPVFILGNPMGLYYSFTDGMVTATYNDILGLPGGRGGASRNLMAISADFGAGASGSPILDSQGDVVGIVSSTHIIEENSKGHPLTQMVVKNAIPISSLKKLLSSVNAGKK